MCPSSDLICSKWVANGTRWWRSWRSLCHRKLEIAKISTDSKSQYKQKLERTRTSVPHPSFRLQHWGRCRLSIDDLCARTFCTFTSSEVYITNRHFHALVNRHCIIHISIFILFFAYFNQNGMIRAPVQHILVLGREKKRPKIIMRDF